MTNLLAAENLLAPLLLGYLLACASSWIGGFSAGRAAVLGLLAGLLCLTRASFYFIPIVWLVGALAARLGARRIIRELLVMLVVAHAVLLPWAIRNARTLGRFTPFNLVGGVGIFMANNPNATGEWYAWDVDLEKRHPGVIARGHVAIDDAAREDALAVDQSQPGRRRPAVRAPARDHSEGRRIRRGVRHLREGDPAPERSDRRPVLPAPARRPPPPRPRSPSSLRRAPRGRRSRRLLAPPPEGARRIASRPRPRRGSCCRRRVCPPCLRRHGRQRPLSLGRRGCDRASRGSVSLAADLQGR